MYGQSPPSPAKHLPSLQRHTAHSNSSIIRVLPIPIHPSVICALLKSPRGAMSSLDDALPCKRARLDDGPSPSSAPVLELAGVGSTLTEPGSSALMERLPTEVLVSNILPALGAPDLCALMATCTKNKALLTDPGVDALVWGAVTRSLWESPLLQDAVSLAGSFRSFALQKRRHVARGVADWKTPCEFEMQASLLRLAAAASAPIPSTPRTHPAIPSCAAISPVPEPLGCISRSTSSASSSSDDSQLAAPSTPSSPSATSDGPRSHILFLLDGSGSVGDEEFAASTSFIARAAADAKARSSQLCKVAVMQFSNDVRTEWEDGSSTCTDDLNAFKATIQSMVRMNGGTNIAAALTHACKVLKRDAGADVAKVIVLITDGRVDGYQAKEARHVASMLVDEQPHTTMFAYGVGRGVDRAELLSIIGAARPSADCAFRAPESRYMDLFHREEPPW